MKKTHLAYLNRAVSVAISIQDPDMILKMLTTPDKSGIAIYGLIRDIVADARFYSITESDDFWRPFSTFEIKNFIDSLSPEDWDNPEILTKNKEDFLTDWLANNMLPISDEEKERRKSRLEFVAHSVEANNEEEEYDNEGIIRLGAGVKDYTGYCNCDAAMLSDDMRRLITPEQAPRRGIGRESNTDILFLENLDPTLRRLVEMIGRSRGSSSSTGIYQHASRCDISGITTGNDLNSLLPIELALLGNPSTENIFLQKYTRKRLQIFSSVSRKSQSVDDKKGPIYICIDSSGSMNGQPLTMAKSLAIAFAISAQREMRPVVIINYSHKVSFFILTDYQRQKLNLISYLSRSHGGGNDENILFRFLFEQLPFSRRFSKLKNRFSGADLLMISDFMWQPLNEKITAMISEAREKGMRIFSLAVDLYGYDNVSYSGGGGNNESHVYNGRWFYKESDYRLVYKHNKLSDLP